MKKLALMVGLLSSTAFAGVGFQSNSTVVVDKTNGVNYQTPYGEFFIDGDVELNLDTAQTSYKEIQGYKDNGDEIKKAKARQSVDGRALIRFSGIKNFGAKYVGFIAEPKANLSGGLDADNVAVFLGSKRDYKVTVGRYEAYNLFPLNQDTFLNHAGNIYQANEGRGRVSNGGGIQYVKYSGPLAFELNTLVNKTDAYGQDFVLDKDGKAVDFNTHNQIWLRPVLSYTTKQLAFAIGFEKDLNKQQSNDKTPIVERNEGVISLDTVALRNRFKDSYAGIGVGLTTTYNISNTSKVTFNYATNNEDLHKNNSYALSGLFNNTGVGVIIGNEKVKEDKDSDPVVNDQTRSVYLSQKFPAFFGTQGFDLTVGVYHSQFKNNLKLNSDESNKSLVDNKSRNKQDMGLRARFNYNF